MINCIDPEQYDISCDDFYMQIIRVNNNNNNTGFIKLQYGTLLPDFIHDKFIFNTEKY